MTHYVNCDLVLLHAPGVRNGKMDHPDNPPCLREENGALNWSLCRKSAWAALNNFKRTGHIRAIGVANFGVRQIDELGFGAQYPVQVNQIESHPWNPNQALIQDCQNRGIVVTAYGSLGSKRLAAELLNNEAIVQVSISSGKTPSQILLRWALQRNVTVIPGTSNPEHMRENLATDDFDLDSSIMEWLSSMQDRVNIYGHVPDRKGTHSGLSRNTLPP